jgi:hypothetical protein
VRDADPVGDGEPEGDGDAAARAATATPRYACVLAWADVAPQRTRTARLIGTPSLAARPRRRAQPRKARVRRASRPAAVPDGVARKERLRGFMVI